MRVDGKMKDLAHVVDHDAKIGIVTSRDPEALELLRHDAAHVLAQAVQELYPGTQITFGPATEDGFYYDFVRDQPFSPEDFAKIEQRMAEIVDRDLPITREVWDRAEDQGLLRRARREASRPSGPTSCPRTRRSRSTSRATGSTCASARTCPRRASSARRSSSRRCRAPTGAATPTTPSCSASTARCSSPTRTSRPTCTASRKPRSATIAGSAARWASSISRKTPPAWCFWHPKGWTFWRTLESYLRRKLEAGGYVEVKTPQLNDRRLWEKSGHWEKFRENMYLSENEEGLKEFVADPAQRIFALKPMNCPCHIQIFNQGLRSYRELPLRMAEMGSCHRFEPSGALHGILRVRAFTQDDAHIFCSADQIEAETIRFCELAGLDLQATWASRTTS